MLLDPGLRHNGMAREGGGRGLLLRHDPGLHDVGCAGVCLLRLHCNLGTLLSELTTGLLRVLWPRRGNADDRSRLPAWRALRLVHRAVIREFEDAPGA